MIARNLSRAWQGLKPNSLAKLYGPTKSRALIQDQALSGFYAGQPNGCLFST
jgi:hypothetical protein